MITKFRNLVRVAFTPAPHRSLFLGAFYFVLIMLLLKYVGFYAHDARSATDIWLKTIAAALALSLIVYGLAEGFNRFRRWPVASIGTGIVEIATISLAVTIGRAVLAATNFPSNHLNELAQPYWVTFVSNFGTILALSAALNLLQANLSQRLKLAQELTTNLRARQKALVFSDEQIREQVAQFLHNRVQSDLMVTNLQIKEIAKTLDAKNSKALMEVVARLESVRSFDIRALSHSLGPNLTHQSLDSSVAALASQCAQQINIVRNLQGVYLGALTKPGSQLELGVYRIIEQSLLNALVHASAKNFAISLTPSNRGWIDLILEDDGGGSVADSTPGLGTSIIDAWVDILGGQKAVETSPGAGYKLTIHLPLDPEQRP